MRWRPRLRDDVDYRGLSLDSRQGFLLSRLDGQMDLDDLALLTGLEPAELTAMLLDLVDQGVVAPDADAVKAASPTHRGLFEQQLHARPAEARAARARGAGEPELSAFCYDPAPEVIQALFQNPQAGPVHARLVAAHHRTAAGLETVAALPAFAGDGGVRRALLQNPMLPASLFRRLWGGHRLHELYLAAESREAAETVRAMAREALRAAFGQRSADEKADLVTRTEGRCLPLLAGLAVDGHTTQLLCRHSYHSTLLIQNIARWSGAPPALLAHLLRQETVRRNVQLRLLLERHPNAKSPAT